MSEDLRLKAWREAVFRRDGYRCRKCKGTERLQAHHIKSQTTHPELKYKVSNGKTLCFDCHRKERSSKVRFLLSLKSPKPNHF